MSEPDLEGQLAEALLVQGVPRSDIEAARESGLVALLAVETNVLPDLRYDIDEAATRTGLDVERICTLLSALGFAAPHPGERIFNDTDIEQFRSVAALVDSGLADPEVVIQMTRVVGASIARIANVQVELLTTRAETRQLALGEGAEWFDDAFGSVLVQVWRRHLQAAARARLAGRLRESTIDEVPPQAVGFADLVGFTALSQQLDSGALAGVVDRFETVAFSIIGGHGGRVVKMIGDEVMFAIDDPVAAARCALDLAESYHQADDLSDVRVGLAFGMTVDRDGDLFGPPVNLASRITGIAYPGTVVVDDAMYHLLEDHDEFVFRTMLPRRLKHIGLATLHVLRRADGDRDPSERRQRRRARVAELIESAYSIATDAGPGSEDG